MINAKLKTVWAMCVSPTRVIDMETHKPLSRTNHIKAEQEGWLVQFIEVKKIKRKGEVIDVIQITAGRPELFNV